MRVLMIGDVVGRPGRRTVAALLPQLKTEHRIDLVVAQGENLAAGFGLTLNTVRELLDVGVDVITTGNHVWDQRDILPHLDDESLPVVRPLNYPDTAPGRGCLDAGKAIIVNLIGRVFVGEAESPFRTVDRLLADLRAKAGKPVLVDFHAEATSEKAAMGWFLDGRVAAVAGTHTHVATADARVLPNGTAYVSDIGMVGATDSVLGMSVEDALFRFLNNMPRRLRIAKGPTRFNSVLIHIDDLTGHATAIERLDRELTA